MSKTTIRARHHAIEIDLPAFHVFDLATATDLFDPLAGNNVAHVRRAEDARLHAILSVLDRLGPNARPEIIANATAQVQCLATHGGVGDWIACDQDGDGAGMAALAKRLGPVFAAAQRVGK